MELGLPKTRMVQRVHVQGDGGRVAAPARRGSRLRAETEGDGTMQLETRSRRMEAVQAHPVAELLECPPEVGLLLNVSAQCINFEAGDVVFRQSGVCSGLYLVISGQFQRRTERLETHLMLAPARSGELVELAAALGDGYHTYTLAAQSAGSVLLLPIEALNKAFQSYPPLRMQLLKELAREVSRAYVTCCICRTAKPKRGSIAEA